MLESVHMECRTYSAKSVALLVVALVVKYLVVTIVVSEPSNGHIPIKSWRF